MTRHLRHVARNPIARARMIAAAFAWLAGTALLAVGAPCGAALVVLLGGAAAYVSIQPAPPSDPARHVPTSRASLAVLAAGPPRAGGRRVRRSPN